MKKTFVLITLAILVLIGGCESAYDSERYNYLLRHADKFTLAHQQKRENLVTSFKVAYPDNWEEKLLEYDLQQEILQKQQHALSQQQELIRQNQEQMAWRNFWQGFSHQQQAYQQQRMYDAQYNYYTRPYKVGDGPTIYP